MGDLARMADDVEAGRVELPRRWKLDRPSPGVQAWTTPSGRRYACDPTGETAAAPGRRGTVSLLDAVIADGEPEAWAPPSRPRP